MRVSLKNVGIIDSCDVEFVPGMNLIVGSSGSGKSTLLRSIHNIAVNEFSDSDISFGKESMSISIECDGNTVEYHRSTKSKGDKFYYVINGEKYSKVGRQSLSAANDILRLGDICINGDNINFSFNMQFSTPFLIFGSQSTLYNVLTYRSQFDISKINDCYNTDVKANNNEINTIRKVRDQLNENLDQLRIQETRLKPVENLYSSYMSYKHLDSNLSEINYLLCKIQEKLSYSSKLENLAKVISDIDIAMSQIETLAEIHKCGSGIESAEKLDKFINTASSLDASYSSAESLSNRLKDVSLLNIMLHRCNKETHNLEALQSSISKSESSLKHVNFINSLIEINSKIILQDKLCKLTDALSVLNDSAIDTIDNLFVVHRSITDVMTVDNKILNLSDRLHEVSDELSSFKVCPLCGSYLHSEDLHEDEKNCNL